MMVRMISQISGGRADGRIWPPANGLVEVPDAEGADLVRGAMAWPGDNFAAERLEEMGVVVPDYVGEPPADAEPAADGEPAAGEAEPSEAAGPPDAEAGTEAAADGEAEAGPQSPPAADDPALLMPAPHDIKQRWIDYAVSQGEDPETARDMTKADLMSKYGGRL
jgi:hypothetical protein